MKAFKFRFAAALRQRNLLLDAATGALAEAESRRVLAEKLLLERRQLVHELASQERASGPFDPNAELIRQRHLYGLREEIQRREVLLAQLTELVEEKRQEVAEAHRDLRAMEILEEKEREAWRKEVLSEEQKETDDRNSQRHNR